MMSNPLLTNIPTNPGCYLMKNAGGAVIYVGKAKHLRKRVTSYWHARDYKTTALVAEIVDIETIVTDTEEEALILEAQLIQAHHPKYNIDLQTPGRYAYIKLTEEAYPRFVIARKVTKDGKFFGPYPSAAARNQLLRSVNALFQLCSVKRTSSRAQRGIPRGLQKIRDSSPQTRNDRRPCFRHHLGQCAGACAELVSKDEHAAAVKLAVRFLRGEYSSLIKETEQLMREQATHEHYEQAKIYRDRLYALQKQEEQKLSQPKKIDQDIVNYITTSSENTCCHPERSRAKSRDLLSVNSRVDSSHTLGMTGGSSHSLVIQCFHFNRGIISGRKEFTFDCGALTVNDSPEMLRDFMLQYYSSHAIPSEIVIPEMIPDRELLERYFRARSGHPVSFIIPRRGIKKKLLELVKKNLLTKLGEGGGQLTELQRSLHLKELPRVIDCVDISHLSGTETVGSLVQFTNGQPTKGGYRKFTIKTVKGNNDVASIYEVITRFGRRVKEKKEIKPDLLMIDGGKGQLNSALRALANVGLEVPTIGLAKRLEEVYLPDIKTPILLAPRSSALQLLRAIRDEAHRFAITFQRKRRLTSFRTPREYSG